MSGNDYDDLLGLAKTGIDAEAFLRTPLGTFLADKARAEEMAAIEALIDADPNNVVVCTGFRNQVHVARMFLRWLTEAIDVGHAANEQMREMEELEQRQ